MKLKTVQTLEFTSEDKKALIGVFNIADKLFDGFAQHTIVDNADIINANTGEVLINEDEVVSIMVGIEKLFNMCDFRYNLCDEEWKNCDTNVPIEFVG